MTREKATMATALSGKELALIDAVLASRHYFAWQFSIRKIKMKSR
jgi:hypothetical protein